MIKIYTAPSCLSCRKVKKYFKEHNIKFIEKNILQTPLTRDDFGDTFVMHINATLLGFVVIRRH